ncbi:MAG: cytochrome c biogenesis CcdA family protein [Rhizobiaceae bacterium]
MQILFAYLAGILTLINPCILPVIPIALASATGENRYGPVALAAGMCIAFTVLGLALTAAGPAIGIAQEDVARFSALLMIFFGTILVVPRFSEAFATAAAGISERADMGMRGIEGKGIFSYFIGGMLLGIVWSPCIGPTLGGAISLASQGQSLFSAGIIMAAFSLGVSTVILALGYGTREVIRNRQQKLKSLAANSRLIMGLVFLGVGLLLFFNIHHYIEAALLNIMPIWLQDLSVTL